MKIEHLDTQFKKVQPAVIAFFKNLDHLEKTLDDLKMANFENEDISILTVKKKDLDKNILEGVATGAITGATGGHFVLARESGSDRHSRCWYFYCCRSIY